MPPIPLISSPTSAPLAPDREQHLRNLSVELEASFVAEMLGHSGLGDTRESFGGGAG